MASNSRSILSIVGPALVQVVETAAGGVDTSNSASGFGGGESKLSSGVTVSNAVTNMPTGQQVFRSGLSLVPDLIPRNIRENRVERRFESEMKDLKGRILAMAGFVEQGIERAIYSLAERNFSTLAEVHSLELKINQLHIEVDNVCLGILARYAPVAVDLRSIIAIVKINTDLERMGDQAVNLSYNTEHYLKHQPHDLAREMPQMAQLVRTMVRESLDAFVNNDLDLAKKVLASDDAVDDFKARVVDLCTKRMKVEPQSIEALINLVLIARNLERMADHATNIAEDVIFVSTGRDVRHGGGRADEKKASEANISENQTGATQYSEQTNRKGSGTNES